MKGGADGRSQLVASPPGEPLLPLEEEELLRRAGVGPGSSPCLQIGDIRSQTPDSAICAVTPMPPFDFLLSFYLTIGLETRHKTSLRGKIGDLPQYGMHGT